MNITETLSALTLPRSELTLKKVASISEQKDHVLITWGFPVALKTQTWLIEQASRIDASLILKFSTQIRAHQVQSHLTPHGSIKNIIAIASGKGGVGKSTVTANLASALSRLGARVGVLDADIYGPSQPSLFNINSRPESKDQKTLEPIEQYGVKTMSIGYLIDDDQAVIWRGPMVSKALQQLLRDTQWGELDYLLIDLPPGTGDIQLTLAQKIPLSGAITVTTPQDLALRDVERAIAMFDKVNVPILGVVENMSIYHCPHCQTPSHPFGKSGGEKIATSHSLPLLAQLPLSQTIFKDADEGYPTAAKHENHPDVDTYISLAEGVGQALASRKRDYSLRMPKVEITSS